MARPRRLLAAAAAVVLTLSACRDALVSPAPADGLPLSVSLSLAPARAAELGRVFDRADRVRIRASRDDVIVVDTALAFASSGADVPVRVRLPGDLGGTAIGVSVTLEFQGSALFTGSAQTTVPSAGPVAVPITLVPVPARLGLPAALPVLTAIGDTLRVAGAVLFATGDTITGLQPAWSTSTPTIVQVGEDGMVVARAEGTGRLIARAGLVVDSVAVTVRQAVASVTVQPAGTSDVPVGGTLQLTGIARDARGTPVARVISWSSSNASIASVDANGLVHGVASGTATITASAEQRSATVTVRVVAPRPTITAFEPASATAGQPSLVLTVLGTGFTQGSSVLWNGQPRQTSFVSATVLRAVLTGADLSRAGQAAVTVSTPPPGGGVSEPRAFPIVNPAPELRGMAPTSVVAGSGAFTLLVAGTGFVDGSVIRWNGQPRQTTRVAVDELRAVIPATDTDSVAIVPVTVFNPGPGGGESQPLTFTVGHPLPVLDSISPDRWFAGEGPFTLTARGSRFAAGAVIVFDGVALETEFVSGSEVTARVPGELTETPRSVLVAVVNPSPGGGSSDQIVLVIEGEPPSDAPAPALRPLHR